KVLEAALAVRDDEIKAAVSQGRTRDVPTPVFERAAKDARHADAIKRLTDMTPEVDDPRLAAEAANQKIEKLAHERAATTGETPEAAYDEVVQSPEGRA